MRFNARGDLAAGFAGGVLSVNRVRVGRAGGFSWRDRDRLLANGAVQDATGADVWGLYEFRRADGWQPTLVDRRGSSTLAAGSGNFIATLNSQPEYQTYGVVDGNPIGDPLAHSHALDGYDDSPLVCAAPDYLTLYARWPDGEVETIPIEQHWNPSTVCAVPGGIVDMVEGIGLQWRARGQAPRVIQTIDAAFDPISFLDRNGVRWFLYHNEGTYLHRDGAQVGYNLPASYGPAVFYFPETHRARVALTPSAGELPETISYVDLALGVDEVPLEKPVVVVKVGRRMWFGFFTFAGRSRQVPTNCDLAGWTDFDGFIRANDGTPIGRYVAVVNDENNIDELERLTLASQFQYPTLVSVPYWTRQAQATRFPKGAKAVGAEWYCLAEESDRDFEIRIRQSCRLAADNHARVWGIAQVYTSNDRLTKNLRRIVPIVARVAATEPNVDAVLGFSGTGRGTGLQDHPEVVDLWNAFAVGIIGAPPIVIVPPPPPPTPPPPIDPPPTEETDMPLPKTISLVTREGYVNVDSTNDNDHNVTHAKPTVSGDELFDVLPHNDTGRVSLRHRTTKRFLSITEFGDLQSRRYPGDDWKRAGGDEGLTPKGAFLISDHSVIQTQGHPFAAPRVLIACDEAGKPLFR